MEGTVGIAQCCMHSTMGYYRDGVLLNAVGTYRVRTRDQVLWALLWVLGVGGTEGIRTRGVLLSISY